MNSIPDVLSPPKPEAVALRPAGRDDPAQGGYLPPRGGGLPDKSPVNGTEAPSKALGAPTPASYNRYVPKPYTSSARPFERKFDSPKFNHNLLPNDTAKPPPLGLSGSSNNNGSKPQLSPQPVDHDSGLDTFTRTMDNRPKYQHNNVSAAPKAIPVR